MFLLSPAKTVPTRPETDRVASGIAWGADAHPLGPLLYCVRSTGPLRTRGASLLVFAVCAAVLAAAAWMTPDRSGFGTHRQLLPATCTALMLFGYPCPSCGMTTAFAHAVRGDLLAAFHAQPAGMVLAMVTMVVAGVSLNVLITAKVWKLNWYRVPPVLVPVAVVLLVVCGWLYKLCAGLVSGTFPLVG